MTAWLTHVKKTMKAHKGMKFGQVLKLAKKTYHKGGKQAGGDATPHNDFGATADISSAGPNSASPFHASDAAPVGGRRRSRRSRKTRRGSRRA
jgi:hypothetical protein